MANEELNNNDLSTLENKIGGLNDLLINHSANIADDKYCHSNATKDKSGFLSAEDKLELDNMKEKLKNMKEKYTSEDIVVELEDGSQSSLNDYFVSKSEIKNTLLVMEVCTYDEYNDKLWHDKLDNRTLYFIKDIYNGEECIVDIKLGTMPYLPTNNEQN